MSDVKEGVYQRLTAGGIAAFPGVARLVERVRLVGCLVVVRCCVLCCVTACLAFFGWLFARWSLVPLQPCVGAKLSAICPASHRPAAKLTHPPLLLQAQALGLGVAVASSGSPEKIAHNLGSSGLAPLFPDLHLVRPDCYRACHTCFLPAWHVFPPCSIAAPGPLPPGSVICNAPGSAASPLLPLQVVSAKHVARGKPAPDVYLEALRRLGCTDASRALVVEDAGGWAGRGCGCGA